MTRHERNGHDRQRDAALGAALDATRQAMHRANGRHYAEAMPPHDIEAEINVLGSILINPDGIARVAEWLTPHHFYRTTHHVIYQAMLALHRRGDPPSLVPLLAELHSSGKLADAGGQAEVSALGTTVENWQSLEVYARIVVDRATRRALDSMSQHVTEAAHSPAPAAEAVAKARTWLDAIEEDPAAQSADTAAQASRRGLRLMSVQEVLHQPRPEPLMSGIYSLNSTGLVYAPPGIGKTVFVLDQLAHVALGWAWNGHAVTGGHGVYICAEGFTFLPERLRALMLKLGTDDIPRLHILPARIQLLDPRTVASVLAAFRASLPSSEPIVWIVIDTVSQTADGASENDASDMAKYIGALEEIREQTGAFVSAIHHTGKDTARGARGSSAFLGNFDTVIELTDEGEDAGAKVATVHCRKQRGGWKEFPAFSFRVASRALDENADETGPVIELLDTPLASRDDARREPVMPKQTRRVWSAFASILKEYEDTGTGVFWSTWEKQCIARGIPKSTFQDGVRRLKQLGLVEQPDTTQAWYPTASGDELLSTPTTPIL